MPQNALFCLGSSTLASQLFVLSFEKQLSIFSFLDFEEAGKWTTQIIDLKRTREEIRPGTCGEREVYNTLFKFALGSTTFK